MKCSKPLLSVFSDGGFVCLYVRLSKVSDWLKSYLDKKMSVTFYDVYSFHIILSLIMHAKYYHFITAIKGKLGLNWAKLSQSLGYPIMKMQQK